MRGSLNNIPVSFGHIKSAINRSIRECDLSLPLTRESLIKIVKHLGLIMSYGQATEVILYCRGPDLEHSTYFDMDRLVEWFVKNIKTLRSIDNTFDRSLTLKLRQ